MTTMRDGNADPRIRLEAAKAAAPYVHAKLDDTGKKKEREKAAQNAGKGRFAPAAPPKLVVNNK